MTDIRELLKFARGLKPVDLLLINGRVIDVFTGRIETRDIAIAQGYIVGYGGYEAGQTIDLQGDFLAPSLIDAHIHVESTMLTLDEFAKAVVPHGTGAVIADPHEFANVSGKKGIEYLLEKREGFPVDIFVMAPSCVPATPFDHSGHVLRAADLASFKNNDHLIGLAEMMNYPGVLFGDEDVFAKLDLFADAVIDGHAPMVTGKDLAAYRISGPSSEHESTSKEEALEKLSMGIHIHMREGSTEHNLSELLPLVTAVNSRHFSFASDDRHPLTLRNDGHLEGSVRMALASGLDPVLVFQIASLNTARHYRLKSLGALAPGFFADFITFKSLKDFRPDMVFKRGVKVAEGGEALFDFAEPIPPEMLHTVRLDRVEREVFEIAAEGDMINLIEIVPGQILTKRAVADVKIVNGQAVSDSERDIIKVAVLERHRHTAKTGKGFVRGFGLQKGAIASSVGHDSHNVIVIGENDRDMAMAVNRLIETGGGYTAALDGKIIAELPLPVSGLVSDQPLEKVVRSLEELSIATDALGMKVAEPFSVLSFLPLTPVPEIRIIDSGLFDAQNFQPMKLFV